MSLLADAALAVGVLPSTHGLMAASLCDRGAPREALSADQEGSVGERIDVMDVENEMHAATDLDLLDAQNVSASGGSRVEISPQSPRQGDSVEPVAANQKPSAGSS